MVEPGMEGIPEAKAAAEFWSNEWSDPTFMAIGELHANLGLKTMLPLSRTIRGCPEPMRIKDAGHFVQERGEPIARAALHAFGDA